MLQSAAMKLNEWISEYWKTVLLCLVFILLVDIDIQLHSLNVRNRHLAATVSDLNDRVSNVENSTAIMQDDLDEITGHSGNDDGDGNTRN